MTIPRATLRLQLHRGFTFDDAAKLIPYVDALGISHLYLSPIFTARAGSTHGYDVIDPTTVNPELGGESAFRNLVGALRERGLGIILDIVPNHMAVGGSDNRQWLDVLQHGARSKYARFFDIDWEPDDPTLRGKILLPFLGKPYADALKDGDIKLSFNETRARYEARYFQHVFPIAPESTDTIERLTLAAYDPSNESGPARLHALLEQQHFRLAHCKMANDAINWRRFFDINNLAAVRVEDEIVFEETHAKLFQLYREGLVDGVRIDHIDGLTDPKAYCQRLRARFNALAREAPAPRQQAYIVVEKILGPDENLPNDWCCQGTSGYDFMNQVSCVLHDPRGAHSLARLWASLSGRSAQFLWEEEACRREILRRSFAAQFNAAVSEIYRLAQSSLLTRDIAKPAIARALTEVLAHLHVYRTYAKLDEASEADRRHLGHAVERALETCFRADRSIVRQLADWVGGVIAHPNSREGASRAITKFQQLSAPLAAKAVEDTAFYRYGRLLSRNDVGFDPTEFATDAETFHQQCIERVVHFPHAMLATATHDHKRGEDVRARLAVLSELPDLWESTVRLWLKDAEALFTRFDGKLAPSRGDAAILFQMLIGAWPLELQPDDAEGCAHFAERLAAWQRKALREAKLETDWSEPNELYEEAALKFLTKLFDRPWPGKICAFVDRIAPSGVLNSLAQLLLKLTTPGVPDIYQGTDFWDFSLVDPDNRRPVDFSTRTAALAMQSPAVDLASTWRDGRVKQAVIRDVLAVRRTQGALFERGNYRPLHIEGPGSEHVLAFAREDDGAAAVVVACRHGANVLKHDEIAMPAYRLAKTRLRLPTGLQNRQLYSVLTRTPLAAGEDLNVSMLADRLPIALLISRA